MTKILAAALGAALLAAAAPAADAQIQYDRLERLKSRVKSGVDFYRDGNFTISRLSKHRLGGNSTSIRGFLTNDTNKRAVSVQMEITCYNEAGDLLGTELVEVNYLDPRGSQQFQAKFRRDSDEITLFEAAVQDTLWDEP